MTKTIDTNLKARQFIKLFSAMNTYCDILVMGCEVAKKKGLSMQLSVFMLLNVSDIWIPQLQNRVAENHLYTKISTILSKTILVLLHGCHVS